MQRLLAALTLCAGLLVAPPASAAEVKTAFGSFTAPDGLAEVNREEKTDPKTGKPAGMVVLTRADDPKAVFIILCTYAEPDPARPYDPLDGAVKIGNPFDKSLTRDAAKPVQVGGAEGGRYEGKLPNGLRAVSYVAMKDGYRIVVLLKGPPSSPYQETMQQIGKGIERFAWALPAPAAQAASAPQ
jgi:hypothetical protein